MARLNARPASQPIDAARLKVSGPLDQTEGIGALLPAQGEAHTATTSPATNTAAARKSRPPLTQSELLMALQERYALIDMNGKVWMLKNDSISAKAEDGTAGKLAFSSRSDGTLLLQRSVNVLDPSEDARNVIEQFFIGSTTRCYDGVEFNPRGSSGNRLNLWIGPTVQAKAGEWRLIQSFLLEVICDGDHECYCYLIRFIAHALQRPEEKPGILIILIGGQGTGKGTLGRILRLIWSATYLQVHNIDAVTGNFNASLERAFIVFMDEALFAGDRKASDSLKSLVTEPVIHINEKHQPARQTHSYHRFFAATNADHFKNTERDDRRDVALRLSEARKGDHEYWQALNFEIEQGGVAAMVHELRTMDLTGFNVRQKPETKELLAQKLQSLGPIPRWWHDCMNGGGVDADGHWADFIATEAAISGIVELAGGRLYKKPSPADVVQALLKLCPSAAKTQQQDKLKRQRGLSLPPLQQARAEFEQYIGGAINWDSDEPLENAVSIPDAPDEEPLF
jgi:hypothetical protein